MIEIRGDKVLITAGCSNPASYQPGAVFIFSKDDDDEALRDIIDEARRKLKRCPACGISCQFRKVAYSTPEKLRVSTPSVDDDAREP